MKSDYMFIKNQYSELVFRARVTYFHYLRDKNLNIESTTAISGVTVKTVE